jgi:hypothetical protein
VASEKPENPIQAPLVALVDRTLHALNDADAAAAAKRVQAYREKEQAASDDALVERLIKQKTLQTGTVGAVTSAASLIPGVGSLAAFTLGVATDVGVTLRLQSELVLEIAAVRGHTLTGSQGRNALLIVTGVNMGAERVVNQASRKLAQEAAERLAGRAFAKAIPFFGIAISAAANMITTYVVGRRADAYFRLGPDAVGNWNESMRAITGLDERKLLGWLEEILANVGQMLAGGVGRAQQAAGAMWQRIQRKPKAGPPALS